MGARVADAAGQVRDRVQDVASDVAQRVEDAWDSTREGASAVAQKAEDFWTSTSNLIRRYPVTSVVIAFGLGCLTFPCLQNVCGMNLWSSDDVADRMSRASAR
jgi:hypothetical protein